MSNELCTLRHCCCFWAEQLLFNHTLTSGWTLHRNSLTSRHKRSFTNVVSKQCGYNRGCILDTRPEIHCYSYSFVQLLLTCFLPRDAKLITRTISPTSSFFVAQTPSTYSQGNMGKFGEDYMWGGKKSLAGAQKRQYLWQESLANAEVSARQPCWFKVIQGRRFWHQWKAHIRLSISH